MYEPKEKKVKISITLYPSTIEKLQVLTEIEYRSLSAIIELICRKYITFYEKKHGPLQ